MDLHLHRAPDATAAVEVIPAGRAFRYLRMTRASWLSVLLLPPLCNLLLWCGYEYLVLGWYGAFAQLHPHLLEGAELMLTEHAYLDLFRFVTPTLHGIAAAPAASHYWLNLALIGGLFALSGRLRERFLPLGYLLRMLCVIWLASLLFFLLLPDQVPHSVSGHLGGSLLLVQVMMVVLPWGLAAVYYVFPFPLWQKLGVSLLMLGWLALMAPLQYLLHAWLLAHASLIVLPLLYGFVGLSLEMLVVIGLYAWAMSLAADDGAVFTGA